VTSTECKSHRKKGKRKLYGVTHQLKLSMKIANVDNCKVFSTTGRDDESKNSNDNKLLRIFDLHKERVVQMDVNWSIG
jgi:hypothetical protein